MWPAPALAPVPLPAYLFSSAALAPPALGPFRWEERIGPHWLSPDAGPFSLCLCSALRYGGGDYHIAVLSKVLSASVFSLYLVAYREMPSAAKGIPLLGCHVLSGNFLHLFLPIENGKYSRAVASSDISDS